MPFSRNVLCTRSSHTCSLLALGISCTTTTLFQSLRLTYRLYFGFDSTRLGAARRDHGRAPRAGDERLCMFFSHLMACSALEVPLRPIKHVPVTPATNCNEGGWAVKACEGACRNSTAGAPMQQRGSSRQWRPAPILHAAQPPGPAPPYETSTQSLLSCHTAHCAPAGRRRPLQLSYCTYCSYCSGVW